MPKESELKFDSWEKALENLDTRVEKAGRSAHVLRQLDFSEYDVKTEPRYSDGHNNRNHLYISFKPNYRDLMASRWELSMVFSDLGLSDTDNLTAGITLLNIDRPVEGFTPQFIWEINPDEVSLEKVGLTIHSDWSTPKINAPTERGRDYDGREANFYVGKGIRVCESYRQLFRYQDPKHPYAVSILEAVADWMVLSVATRKKSADLLISPQKS